MFAGFSKVCRSENLALEIKRFAISGFANTALSLLVMRLIYIIAKNHYFANGIGYLFGILLSYFLSKHFVFRPKDAKFKYTRLRFVLALALAFAANMLVLWITLNVLGLSAVYAYALALITYTGINFLLQKSYVFG